MKTVLLAGLLAMTAPAFAQDAASADTHGIYAGIGATHSDHEWMSGKSTNVKLFGGYDFNEHWGIELGTSKIGSFSFSYSDPSNLSQQSTLRGRSSYIAAKFTTALTDKLSIQSKLGLAHTSVKYHFVTSGVPGPLDLSRSDNGVYVGLGLKYRLTPKVALLLEAERNGKQVHSGMKNEAVSLNASFSF